MSHIIATFFYIGHLRPAPGSWGSLAALMSGAAVINGAELIGLCIGILLACLLGYWATARETAEKSDHDPSEIVIDEVAGQWITLLPLAIWPLPFDSAAFYYLFGFVAFRLFDITKPGLVGWADRLVGPLALCSMISLPG